MTRRSRDVRGFMRALMLVLGCGLSPAMAGPQDLSTNYPVGISIGGTEVSGIADTGGTTTISFEDAKKLGILDSNGDPVDPPDGTTSIGGTGGASVKCHRYDKMKIKVQPKNADGTNNGDAKEIEVTVLIPKKPADQTGADDAEKARKTASVNNKLGKNVTGADFGGKKLDEVDKKTKDPKKDERGTRWIDYTVEDRAEVPFSGDTNDQDDTEIPCSTTAAILNGVPMQVLVSTASGSLIPQWMAQQLGAPIVGTEMMSVETQRALYCEGLWPILPGSDAVPVQVAAIMVSFQATDGTMVGNDQPALFFTAPFIQQPLLGANALVPEDGAAWFDSHRGTIAFAMLCLADFDGSGFVDLDDYSSFVSAFENGSDSADFDRSGFVDLDDFTEFVVAFEAGC